MTWITYNANTSATNNGSFYACIAVPFKEDGAVKKVRLNFQTMYGNVKYQVHRQDAGGAWTRLEDRSFFSSNEDGFREIDLSHLNLEPGVQYGFSFNRTNGSGSFRGSYSTPMVTYGESAWGRYSTASYFDPYFEVWSEPVGPTLKRYVDGEWVPATVKRFDNGQWVEATTITKT